MKGHAPTPNLSPKTSAPDVTAPADRGGTSRPPIPAERLRAIFWTTPEAYRLPKRQPVDLFECLPQQKRLRLDSALKWIGLILLGLYAAKLWIVGA